MEVRNIGVRKYNSDHLKKDTEIGISYSDKQVFLKGNWLFCLERCYS